MKYLLFILFAFTLNAQELILLMDEATVAPSGGSHITDSLKHYYVLDSLDNGSVDEWFDAVRNYKVAYVEDTRIFIGGANTSSEVLTGTNIPLARFYNIKFNSTQVNTNYNSDSSQGLLP